MTAFSLHGSKPFPSPGLDLYNGEVIRYAIGERTNYRQVEEVLAKAFAAPPDGSGLFFHSDWGWQYQYVRYPKWLLKKSIEQSMSAKVQLGAHFNAALPLAIPGKRMS